MGGQGSHTLGQAASSGEVGYIRRIPLSISDVPLPHRSLLVVGEWSGMVALSDSSDPLPTALVASEEFRR